MREILINLEAGERRVAILHSKKLQDYFVERVNEKRIVGNIYKGKVSSVLEGMGAAFVECGLEKNGFLYVTDITEPALDEENMDVEWTPNANKNAKITDLLKKNQEILVQIVKEGLGTKGPRITTNISLPGRYLVLMPNSHHIGVSRKIHDDKERRRIKTLMKGLKLPEGFGLVARTAAEGSDSRDFTKDLDYLLSTYREINKFAQRAKAPALIFEELNMSLKSIRDLVTKDTVNVIVDDKLEFKRMRNFTSKIAPVLMQKIIFHREHVSLFEKYDIEKEIDKLFERKIFIKCGGYITIEQTEGMVAIDVNSGRFTGRRNLEDTIYKVNREAAEEVARQLRLRDIGGIVVIDFIDMESQGHRKEVFSILRNALKQDKAKTNIISFSELDIVEMTRQRVRRSLESVSYQNCPHCNGKGLIKSSPTMSIIAMRQLKSYLRAHRAKRIPVELIVHPQVAQRLVNEDSSSLDYLKRVFGRRISVVADDKLHIEEVKIETVR